MFNYVVNHRVKNISEEPAKLAGRDSEKNYKVKL